MKDAIRVRTRSNSYDGDGIKSTKQFCWKPSSTSRSTTPNYIMEESRDDQDTNTKAKLLPHPNQEKTLTATDAPMADTTSQQIRSGNSDMSFLTVKSINAKEEIYVPLEQLLNEQKDQLEKIANSKKQQEINVNDVALALTSWISDYLSCSTSEIQTISSQVEDAQEKVDQEKEAREVESAEQQAQQLKSELNDAIIALEVQRVMEQALEDEKKLAVEEVQRTKEEHLIKVREYEDIIGVKEAKIINLQEQMLGNEASALQQLEVTIHTKEEQIEQLNADLKRATADATDLQRELDSVTLTKDSVASEIAKKMSDLRRQIQITKDSVAQKSEEVSTLNASVAHLEHELQYSKVSFEKKLAEERVRRINETCRLNTSLRAKEKEVEQLQGTLKQAAINGRKMQEKIDSIDENIESRNVDRENNAAEMKDMQDQIEAARDLIEEKNMEISSINAKKNEEVSALTATVNRLENELQNAKKSFDKTLVEERGRSIEETRRLNTSLHAKEIEVDHLQCNLKQATIDAREMQEKIDSIDIITESRNDDRENTAADTRGMQDQIRAIRDSIEERDKEIPSINAKKNEEVSALTATVNRLENELRDAKESFENQLAEERGRSIEDTRRLNTSLRAKEKEIDHLHLKLAIVDAREMQEKVASTNLLIEAKVLELETFSEKMRDIQDQIGADKGSMEEKNEETLNLTASVKRLEDEMQDTKISSEITLAEERGSRLDETRRLNTLLRAKEKEVDQLQGNLKQAIIDSRKMQEKIDSTSLLIEVKVLEIEAFSELMRDLHDQLGTAKHSIEEKNEEICNLTATVKRLEDELQYTKVSSEKTLAEERGPRLDETRRLQTILAAKENRLNQLNNDLNVADTETRRLQSTLDSMRLMVKPTLAEISELKGWKLKASGIMEQQSNELEEMKNEITELNSRCEKKQEAITEKENEISFLHGLVEEKNANIEKAKSDFQSKIDSRVEKLNTAACEWSSRFEEEVMAIREERDTLKTDVAEKSEMISGMISENNRMMREINKLTLQNDEAASIPKACDKEFLSSHILTRRIVDLEQSLDLYQKKYEKSRIALAGMEEALLMVEKERAKLMQQKSTLDCVAPETWETRVSLRSSEKGSSEEERLQFGGGGESVGGRNWVCFEGESFGDEISKKGSIR